MRHYFYIILLLNVSISYPAFAADIKTLSPQKTNNSARIVVTNKPIFSLVSALCLQVCQAQLLPRYATSEHYFNLKPSQRRLLAKADILIWVGDQIEPSLTAIIQQASRKRKRVISALDAKNLLLLKKRGNILVKKKVAPNNKPLRSNDLNIDPHIWLSTHNAIAISQHISQQLRIADPANTAQYKTNLMALISKINQLSLSIKNELKQTTTPYISYHDAFQYFDNEFNITYAGSIVFNEETGASIKQIQLVAKLFKQQVKCLIFQPPRPSIINRFSDNINTASLDPMAWQLDSNDAWFLLMQQLAKNFKQCLNANVVS